MRRGIRSKSRYQPLLDALEDRSLLSALHGLEDRSVTPTEVLLSPSTAPPIHFSTDFGSTGPAEMPRNHPPDLPWITPEFRDKAIESLSFDRSSGAPTPGNAGFSEPPFAMAGLQDWSDRKPMWMSHGGMDAPPLFFRGMSVSYGRPESNPDGAESVAPPDLMMARSEAMAHGPESAAPPAPGATPASASDHMVTGQPPNGQQPAGRMAALVIERLVNSFMEKGGPVMAPGFNFGRIQAGFPTAAAALDLGLPSLSLRDFQPLVTTMGSPAVGIGNELLVDLPSIPKTGLPVIADLKAFDHRFGAVNRLAVIGIMEQAPAPGTVVPVSGSVTENDYTNPGAWSVSASEAVAEPASLGLSPHQVVELISDLPATDGSVLAAIVLHFRDLGQTATDETNESYTLPVVFFSAVAAAEAIRRWRNRRQLLGSRSFLKERSSSLHGFS